MAVSKRLRYEVLRRDNHACRYCGGAAPDVALTVDHVIPKALGGNDDPTNLVTACEPCNSGKSASAPDAPIVANVADDALRWAAAMKRAAELQNAERESEYDYFWTFRDIWFGHTFGKNREYTVDLPGDFENSLRQFRSAGLTTEDLRYAVDVAMGATQVPFERIFKYFCGVAWRLVEQRREIAASLIQAEEASADGS